MKKETAMQQHARLLKEREKAADIMVRRELKHLRATIKDLANAVTISINALDTEMKKPSTLERGGRIANICNYLDFNNQRAIRYGLRK